VGLVHRVVGEDALDPDAMAGEERGAGDEEPAQVGPRSSANAPT
jgi:hypothetical protein